MKVELVDLEEFSGNKAHIYSVLLDDAEDTLFDQFVEENGPLYPNEIREIVKELTHRQVRSATPPPPSSVLGA